jgi:hypothetical protein
MNFENSFSKKSCEIRGSRIRNVKIILKLVAYRQVQLPIKVQDVALHKTTVVLGKLGSYPGQIN